jgi:twitching motility protein PilJ
MAFRLPRFFLPLGGARKVDPDTAILDDLTARTGFDPLAVRGALGPAATGAAPADPPPSRRRAAVPFIGGLPLRAQVSILVTVLVASVALASMFVWIDARETRSVARQARLVGDSLMHAQRLARAAPMALRGVGDGFRQLAESRARVGEAVAALQSGGVVREQPIARVDGLLRPSVTRLSEQWKRSEQAAGTLQQLQPMLSSVAQSGRAVLDAQPRLVALAEQVARLELAAGASAAEVAAAVQMSALAHKMARAVVQIAGAEPVGEDLPQVLSRDLAGLRELLEGLLSGTEARRTAPARESEARAKLVEMRAAYADLSRPMAALVSDLPRLAGARAAESRIAADAEPLRAALLELQARLSEGPASQAFNRAATVLFALLALMAAAGLAWAYVHDLDRRAAAADAQRAQAERLEQEASRANERNQAAILRLMNELQDVADGDLTVQATVSEDITGAIADSVNYTIDELRSIVSRINVTAELVAEASARAQSVSSSLQSASERQSREIRDTGEAVLRMAGRIEEVSGRASASATVARQSLGAADHGRLAVQNAIAGMNGIRDQIHETAKRIKRLGESSQEIGGIVELISDLTEQTNVLALNAAIQAASAGEAGRGFTVVAEEVQRLAERSAEATGRISTLIRAIQADTQGAVAAMERSTQGVVAGTRLSDEAGSALGEIGRVSAQLAEMIEEISRTASDQAASAGTVADSIQRILRVTEQTSAGTQQTAGSIRQLAELARELKSSVARFRVDP